MASSSTVKDATSTTTAVSSVAAVPSTTAANTTTAASTTTVASTAASALSTTEATSKRVALVSADELDWLIDMGLGRGVDATKANLWKNKSSFQVESISKSLDNIIVTDEGGARNYYERVIVSVTSMQTQLKLSVSEPHTSANIGVEATYSQSVSKTNKSVGEEVTTRTVSFRTSFDDLPLEYVDDETVKRSSKFISAKAKTPTGETEPTETKTTEIEKSFEEKLSDWLLDRVRIRGEAIEYSEDTKSATVKLSNYLRKASEDCCENIISDCLLFIQSTGVTHYVHSIQLGAKRYRVLSTSEYNKKVGVKGTAGMENLAKATVSQTSSWRKKRSSVNVKEIGKIKDGIVKRGFGHEAVISFKLMPIHTLVTTHTVNHALKTALRNYMVEKAVESKGPYLISCGSDQMRLYWRINELNKVVATTDVETASIFFLTSTDDDSHPHEFMIGHHGEDTEVLMKPKGALDPLSKEKPLAPLARYLNATVSMLGYNNGPLEMKSNLNEADARLVLHNRVFDGYEAVDFNSWMLGEQFYVNCSRRRFSWDGYLAVKRTKSMDYTTAIVPTQKNHNEADIWLLFRLLPVEYKTLRLAEEAATATNSDT